MSDEKNVEAQPLIQDGTGSPGDNPSQNPSVQPGQTGASRRRIPMSVPLRKMEVPPIPGWHLYWFVEGNVPRAIQGGYEFVKADDIPLNAFGLGDSTNGNTDLGTNVSIIAGEGAGGEPIRQVLMKIKQEWYDEDRRIIERQNAFILQSIFRGDNIVGADKSSGEDRAQMYVDKELTKFTPAAPLQSPNTILQKRRAKQV